MTGSTLSKADYFASMAERAGACTSCQEVTSLHVGVNAAIGARLAALQAQLQNVQTSEENIVNDLAAINAEIATMTGSETAFSALSGLTALATAAATATPTNLAPLIAYCQGNANLLVSLGAAGSSSFIASAARLAKDVIKLTRDIANLEAQIGTLTAAIEEIPSQLANLNSIISAKAGMFPNCSLG